MTYKEFAELVAELVIEKMEQKNNTNVNLEDTDYTPYDKMDKSDQMNLVYMINSIKEVAATNHTYERALERGIPREVIAKIKDCTKDNIIGLQNNGRLRIGIAYRHQVAVLIVCVERGVATVITSWLTNIVNYDKYKV